MTVEEVTARLLSLAASVQDCDDQARLHSTLTTADELLDCVVAEVRIDACLGVWEVPEAFTNAAPGSLDQLVGELVKDTPAGWAYKCILGQAARHRR